MLEFQRNVTRKKQINLTPLIDIIFQLVIFFMLSTTFVKMEALDVFVENEVEEIEEPKIKKLTPAQQHFADNKVGPLVIIIGSEISTLNDEEVANYALERKIRAEIDKKKDRKVSVSVQKEVKVQNLVNVIDYVRLAGGTNILIED